MEIEPPAKEEDESDDPVPDLDEASNEAEKEQPASAVVEKGQHKFFMEFIHLLLSYLFLSKLFGRKFASEPAELEDKEDPVPEIDIVETENDTAMEAK